MYKALKSTSLPQNNSPIFCEKCQIKFRGDSGWVHSTNKNVLANLVCERNIEVYKSQALRFNIHNMFSGVDFPKFIYFCPDCKK